MITKLQELHVKQHDEYVNEYNMIYNYFCELKENTIFVVNDNIQQNISYFRSIFFDNNLNSLKIEMGRKCGLHYMSVNKLKNDKLFIIYNFVDKYITFSDIVNMDYKTIEFNLTNISRVLKIKNLKNEK